MFCWKTITPYKTLYWIVRENGKKPAFVFQYIIMYSLFVIGYSKNDNRERVTHFKSAIVNSQSTDVARVYLERVNEKWEISADRDSWSENSITKMSNACLLCSTQYIYVKLTIKKVRKWQVQWRDLHLLVKTKSEKKTIFQISLHAECQKIECFFVKKKKERLSLHEKVNNNKMLFPIYRL